MVGLGRFRTLRLESHNSESATAHCGIHRYLLRSPHRRNGGHLPVPAAASTRVAENMGAGRLEDTWAWLWKLRSQGHWNYAIRPDIDFCRSFPRESTWTLRRHLQIRTVPSWFKRKRAPWKAAWLSHAIQENFGRGKKPIQPGSSSCAHTIYRSPLEAYHRLGANGAVIGNGAPVGKFQAEGGLSPTFRCLQAQRVLEVEGRNRFSTLSDVFEKSRFPKGRSVGDRAYFHALDDTKDHWAARTANLDYMYAPERTMNLQSWSRELRSSIEEFAKFRNLPMPALD